MDNAPRWSRKSRSLFQNEGVVLPLVKARFFEGACWEELMQEFSFPKDAYIKHAHTWRLEMQERDEMILSDIRLKAIGAVCEDLARDSLEIVSRSLSHINKSESILEPKDLKTIFEIATGMWKIAQVEKGGVTSRVEFISPEQAMDVLRTRAKAFSSKHGAIIDMDLDDLPEPEQALLLEGA